MRRRRTAVAALAGALTGLLLAGTACSQLPTDGPVVETRPAPQVDELRPAEVDPEPPQQGASQTEIVNGFLNAMTAWPQRLDVAREYLAEESLASWTPGQATVVYSPGGPIADVAGGVRVTLLAAQRIDGRGVWQGPAPSVDERLDLRLRLEDGEYRIVEPPDALLVPDDWFADRYRRANLYFLDRTGSVLVPEPVFVPIGEQLASSLVTRLIAGPADPRVDSTAVPTGLTVDLSVPVLDDGVADVRLEGAPMPRSSEVVRQMVAQLAWTLEQEEDISAFRLTISGEEVRLTGGTTDFNVSSTPEYHPTGLATSVSLYGLRSGVLVSGAAADLAPVDGTFARRRGIRSVAVSFDGATAAAVTTDGGRLLGGAVRGDGDTPGLPPPTRLMSGATDLLPPAWDHAGRVWWVDRGPGGARVGYVEGRRARTLQVPGVSGQAVSSFLVSRDGTRLVAVVRQDGADVVRVARIQVGEDGAPVRALPPREVLSEADGDPDAALRISDLAWASTTAVAVLTEVVPGARYEVSTVSVDGAPSDTSSASVSAPVVALAASAVPETTPYAVTRDSLVEIPSLQTETLVSGVTGITYAG